MGYYTQAHSDEDHNDLDASDTNSFDDIPDTMDDDIQNAEAYLLEQESIKAKKHDRAILKIRHAIEDYQERKRLKHELDYLSEEDDDIE